MASRGPSSAPSPQPLPSGFSVGPGSRSLSTAEGAGLASDSKSSYGYYRDNQDWLSSNLPDEARSASGLSRGPKLARDDSSSVGPISFAHQRFSSVIKRRRGSDPGVMSPASRPSPRDRAGRSVFDHLYQEASEKRAKLEQQEAARLAAIKATKLKLNPKSVAIASSPRVHPPSHRLYGPIEDAKVHSREVGKRDRAILRIERFGFGSSTRSPRNVDDILLNAPPSEALHNTKAIVRRARSMSPLPPGATGTPSSSTRASFNGSALSPAGKGLISSYRFLGTGTLSPDADSKSEAGRWSARAGGEPQTNGDSQSVGTTRSLSARLEELYKKGKETVQTKLQQKPTFEDVELKSCTFKPTLNRKSLQIRPTGVIPVHQRTLQWHRNKESKLSQQREAVMEGELDGCSFSPDVVRSSRTLGMVYSPTGPLDNSSFSSLSLKANELHGGVDEYLERQARAREMAELRKVTPHSDGSKWTGRPTVHEEFQFDKRGKVVVKSLLNPFRVKLASVPASPLRLHLRNPVLDGGKGGMDQALADSLSHIHLRDMFASEVSRAIHQSPPQPRTPRSRSVPAK